MPQTINTLNFKITESIENHWKKITSRKKQYMNFAAGGGEPKYFQPAMTSPKTGEVIGNKKVSRCYPGYMGNPLTGQCELISAKEKSKPGETSQNIAQKKKDDQDVMRGDKKPEDVYDDEEETEAEKERKRQQEIDEFAKHFSDLEEINPLQGIKCEKFVRNCINPPCPDFCGDDEEFRELINYSAMTFQEQLRAQEGNIESEIGLKVKRLLAQDWNNSENIKAFLNEEWNNNISDIHKKSLSDKYSLENQNSNLYSDFYLTTPDGFMVKYDSQEDQFKYMGIEENGEVKYRDEDGRVKKNSYFKPCPRPLSKENNFNILTFAENSQDCVILAENYNQLGENNDLGRINLDNIIERINPGNQGENRIIGNIKGGIDTEIEKLKRKIEDKSCNQLQGEALRLCEKERENLEAKRAILEGINKEFEEIFQGFGKLVGMVKTYDEWKGDEEKRQEYKEFLKNYKENYGLRTNTAKSRINFYTDTLHFIEDTLIGMGIMERAELRKIISATNRGDLTSMKFFRKGLDTVMKDLLEEGLISSASRPNEEYKKIINGRLSEHGGIDSTASMNILNSAQRIGGGNIDIQNIFREGNMAQSSHMISDIYDDNSVQYIRNPENPEEFIPIKNPFGELTEEFSSMLTVVDENGTLLKSDTRENKIKYMKQAYKYIDETLDKVSISISHKGLAPSVKINLDRYKKAIENIKDRYFKEELNEENSRKNIEDLYKAFDMLYHTAYEEGILRGEGKISSVLTNLSEFELYFSELLENNENKQVYMPKSDKFPSADKLVIEKVEMGVNEQGQEVYGEIIDSISAKADEGKEEEIGAAAGAYNFMSMHHIDGLNRIYRGSLGPKVGGVMGDGMNRVLFEDFQGENSWREYIAQNLSVYNIFRDSDKNPSANINELITDYLELIGEKENDNNGYKDKFSKLDEKIVSLEKEIEIAKENNDRDRRRSLEAAKKQLEEEKKKTKKELRYNIQFLRINKVYKKLTGNNLPENIRGKSYDYIKQWIIEQETNSAMDKIRYNEETNPNGIDLKKQSPLDYFINSSGLKFEDNSERDKFIIQMRRARNIQMQMNKIIYGSDKNYNDSIYQILQPVINEYKSGKGRDDIRVFKDIFNHFMKNRDLLNDIDIGKSGDKKVENLRMYMGNLTPGQIRELNDKLNEMRRIINGNDSNGDVNFFREKMGELIGEENKEEIGQDDLKLIHSMIFSAGLRTSNGFPIIRHFRRGYVKDTVSGTNRSYAQLGMAQDGADMKNWKVNFGLGQDGELRLTYKGGLDTNSKSGGYERNFEHKEHYIETLQENLTLREESPEEAETSENRKYKENYNEEYERALEGIRDPINPRAYKEPLQRILQNIVANRGKDPRTPEQRREFMENFIKYLYNNQLGNIKSSNNRHSMNRTISRLKEQGYSDEDAYIQTLWTNIGAYSFMNQFLYDSFPQQGGKEMSEDMKKFWMETSIAYTVSLMNSGTPYNYEEMQELRKEIYKRSSAFNKEELHGDKLYIPYLPKKDGETNEEYIQRQDIHKNEYLQNIESGGSPTHYVRGITLTEDQLEGIRGTYSPDPESEDNTLYLNSIFAGSILASHQTIAESNVYFEIKMSPPGETKAFSTDGVKDQNYEGEVLMVPGTKMKKLGIHEIPAQVDTDVEYNTYEVFTNIRDITTNEDMRNFFNIEDLDGVFIIDSNGNVILNKDEREKIRKLKVFYDKYTQIKDDRFNNKIVNHILRGDRYTQKALDFNRKNFIKFTNLIEELRGITRIGDFRKKLRDDQSIAAAIEELAPETNNIRDSRIKGEMRFLFGEILGKGIPLKERSKSNLKALDQYNARISSGLGINDFMGLFHKQLENTFGPRATKPYNPQRTIIRLEESIPDNIQETSQEQSKNKPNDSDFTSIIQELEQNPDVNLFR